MSYCPNCGSIVDVASLRCEKCGADFSADNGWRPTVFRPDTAIPASRVQVAGGVVFAIAIALVLWLASFGNVYLITTMFGVGVVGVGGALFAFSPRRRQQAKMSKRNES